LSAAFPDTCQLWQVDLFGESTAIYLLDPAEQNRAARFRFERDRRRFVNSRIALRKILATYLDRDPAQLRFHIGEYGRPSFSDASLQFNITHSEDLALIAVTAQGPLGVDLESVREIDCVLELARRYLHPNEILLLEAAAPADRSEIFLSCWVRKEAVLKSTGAGLTLDTRLLDVGATRDAKTLNLPGFPALRVTSLEPVQGFIAALATAPAVRKFELRRFDP